MQTNLFDTGDEGNSASSFTSLKAELNEAQYNAVTHLDGPVLVIAGAGSGKTRTLVYRVAYLVDQGVSPDNILLLTFTRKASQEMLMRASELLDESCQDVWGGTFHAVGNILLRRYGSSLGYSSNFTITDRADAEGIINLLKSSLGFSGKGKQFPKKRVVLDIISRALNKNLQVEDIIFDQYPHLEGYIDDILQIEGHYQKFKFDHGLMDYDDLLLNWKKMMQENEEVAERIASQFSHILVDEYQDTNYLQAEIIKKLAHSHQNVMAVGDDSQSIYSFRGADFRNIMEFPNYFKDTKVIRLEENYRSTNSILTVANAVIENAQEKYAKTLYTNIEGGDKPAVYSAKDESDQARYVADCIELLRSKGRELNEMAVLFRSGFHSYKLEMELSSRQIGFEKRGGMKLTESAHIKDVVSFIRLQSNNDDNLSWSRVLMLHDKIGPKTVQNILVHLKTISTPFESLKDYPGSKQLKSNLFSLGTLLNDISKLSLPHEIFDRVMEYYRPIFEKIYHDDYPRRSRDLDQLGNLISGYTSVQSFIDDTALDPPESLQADNTGLSANDKVILSTIHSAKGLEWDSVFIIQLADGKFPSTQASFQDSLEEERRLFYVAITRAKNQLHLIYPKMAMGVDRRPTYCRPSPFLDEIPAGMLKGLSVRSSGSDYNRPFQASSFSEARNVASRLGEKKTLNLNEMKPGIQVVHPFFGQGKVNRMVSQRTAEVFFPRHGTKILHLDYARLEIVERE